LIDAELTAPIILYDDLFRELSASTSEVEEDVDNDTLAFALRLFHTAGNLLLLDERRAVCLRPEWMFSVVGNFVASAFWSRQRSRA